MCCVASDIPIETLIHAQAHGVWNKDVFTSTTIKPYNKTYFTGYNKPRILIIGDSIDRNSIHAYCRTIGSPVYNYTACYGAGGHYTCKSNEVDIATFFISGSSLDCPKSNGFNRPLHSCSIMSSGTLDRVRNHLLPSIKNVYGNNTIDIIVINAMLWTIQDRVAEVSTFRTIQFINFAQEYIHNMTVIIQEVRIIMTPSSVILLEKLPYSKAYTISVLKMNLLLDIVAAQNNIGMYILLIYILSILVCICIHTYMHACVYILYYT